jgi:glycosyltransferase involved in cell wall biosynthesis
VDLIVALARVRGSHPETTLRVAGGAPDPKYLDLVKRAIAHHELAGQVTLLGQLTHDELMEEYKRSAFLVLPSAQETSPMVIAELMALGKPVVATRVGGVPDLVEDGRTGFLVEPGDTPDLAERMLKLLSDPALRAAMGKLARERADQQFRNPFVAKRVHEVYRQAISECLPRGD